MCSKSTASKAIALPSIYRPDPGSRLCDAGLRRIGAVHSVVFAGFSPEALAGRIVDCRSTFVITADEGVRGGCKPVPLKKTPILLSTLPRSGMCSSTGSDCTPHRRQGQQLGPGRDLWYHQGSRRRRTDLEPEPMNAEDQLFILYTSAQPAN